MKVLVLTNKAVNDRLISLLVEETAEKVITHKAKLKRDLVKQINPDFVVSCSYHYIISGTIIDMLPNRIINLHISYLPWNRGADPNVWSFLENTPKGVTIHEIDKGLDTGTIPIQQEFVFHQEYETLASTYQKLHEVIQTLFKRHWGDLRIQNIKGRPQKKCGSKHHAKQFQSIKNYLLGEEGWEIPIATLLHRYHMLKERGNE